MEFLKSRKSRNQIKVNLSRNAKENEKKNKNGHAQTKENGVN
jgi:hypothetical protein